MVPYLLEILEHMVMLRNEEGEVYPSLQPRLLLAVCSSGAGGAKNAAPPWEICSSLPLPSMRIPDPAPALLLQTVKLFFLRQTQRQSLPQGACGQGEEMPCYLVSSLFSFWLLEFADGL